MPDSLSHHCQFSAFAGKWSGDGKEMNLSLVYQVQDFVDQYLLQHKLRMRIFKKLHSLTGQYIKGRKKNDGSKGTL